jgi:hypothetical protein
MSTMRGECPGPSGSSLYGCTVRFVCYRTRISKEDNVFCCCWIGLSPLPPPPRLPKPNVRHHSLNSYKLMPFPFLSHIFFCLAYRGFPRIMYHVDGGWGGGVKPFPTTTKNATYSLLFFFLFPGTAEEAERFLCEVSLGRKDCSS